jgi:hypothetical protein
VEEWKKSHPEVALAVKIFLTRLLFSGSRQSSDPDLRGDEFAFHD